MNDSNYSDGLVSKSAAIARLVNSAILMFFREDDELAIHCIAHSALSAAQEILSKRNRDVFSISVGTGLATMLQLIAKSEASDDEAFEWLRENLSDDMSEREFEFFRNVDLTKLHIKVDGLDHRKLWGNYRKNYNFLKHAKTDEHASLDTAELKNEDVIMFSVIACLSVGIQLSTEMLVFFRFWQSASSLLLDLDDSEKGIVEKLKEYELGERKFACRYLIDDNLPAIDG